MYVHDVMLILTNDCNFACDYCFTGKKNRKRMSFGVAKKSVDWLFRGDVSGPGNVFMTFFGGEPLLEFELMKKTVLYALQWADETKKKIGFSATTNGSLVGDDVVEFCQQHGIGLLLSCDGKEESHNVHRRFRNGRGTFKAVEKNMDCVLGLGFGKGARMTITPQNCDGSFEGARWLVEKGFEKLNLFYDYYAEWTERDLGSVEEAFYNLAEYYIEKIEKGNPLTINSIDLRIENLLKPRPGWRKRGICHAGVTHVTVGTNGVFYPCAHFATCSGFRGMLPIGNIRDGLDNERRLPFFRLRRKHILGCDIPCDRCSIVDHCFAGCPGINYELTGHIALNPPIGRYFNIILHDVAQSIVNYFKSNPSPHFDARYKSDQRVAARKTPDNCICELFSADVDENKETAANA